MKKTIIITLILMLCLTCITALTEEESGSTHTEILQVDGAPLAQGDGYEVNLVYVYLVADEGEQPYLLAAAWINNDTNEELEVTTSNLTLNGVPIDCNGVMQCEPGGFGNSFEIRAKNGYTLDQWDAIHNPFRLTLDVDVYEGKQWDHKSHQSVTVNFYLLSTAYTGGLSGVYIATEYDTSLYGEIMAGDWKNDLHLNNVSLSEQEKIRDVIDSFADYPLLSYDELMHRLLSLGYSFDDSLEAVFTKDIDLVVRNPAALEEYGIYAHMLDIVGEVKKYWHNVDEWGTLHNLTRQYISTYDEMAKVYMVERNIGYVEATELVDDCGIDWVERAVLYSLLYDVEAIGDYYSYSGMRHQLILDGFTFEQATAAVNYLDEVYQHALWRRNALISCLEGREKLESSDAVFYWLTRVKEYDYYDAKYAIKQVYGVE